MFCVDEKPTSSLVRNITRVPTKGVFCTYKRKLASESPSRIYGAQYAPFAIAFVVLVELACDAAIHIEEREAEGTAQYCGNIWLGPSYEVLEKIAPTSMGNEGRAFTIGYSLGKLGFNIFTLYLL